MPVDIILDYPRGRLFRRLLRGMAALLGAVLILAALIASSLLFFALTAFLESLATRHELPLSGTSHQEVVQFIVILAIALAVTIMGFLLGLRLVRGKRRLVLFLRRFGFVAATHVLSFTVARATGRAWHLVTLDDLKVAAVGVRPRTRRLTAAIALIALISVVLVAYWLYGGSFDRFINQTADDMASQAAANESDPGKAFLAGLGAAFAGALIAGFFYVGAGRTVCAL